MSVYKKMVLAIALALLLVFAGSLFLTFALGTVSAATVVYPGGTPGGPGMPFPSGGGAPVAPGGAPGGPGMPPTSGGGAPVAPN